MSSKEALSLAISKNLDLLCVAPTAKIPVCKILDYGKWKFEQSKKAKLSKKNQQVSKLKEIKISPLIGIGDLNTKAKQAIKFLSDNNKIYLTLKFKGRQIVHTEIGFATINKFIDLIKDFGQVEIPPKINNRTIDATIIPLKKK